MRVGIGFDAHRFIDGRPLILGGVEIPFHYGLEGHSDADVLIHAIMDAVLGAAALGDIGQHFPDTDDQYRNISSLILLSRVADIIDKNGFRIGNIDCVVVMEEPKLSPYRDEIGQKIADILRIDRDRIGIKASTTEGMGFVGRGEGVSAHAVVLIEEK